MNAAYLVQHERELDDGSSDVKMRGVFRAEEAARDAVAALRAQPDSRDHPDGFHVDAYELDRVHWADGFFTVT